MQVFALTFVTLLLLVTFAHADKVRGGEKRARVQEAVTEEALKTDLATTQIDTAKEKEVHKRGILHYGGALAAGGNVWPKTYASHYGYGLHLPAASGLVAHRVHAAPVFKYHGHGFNYKTLASPAVVPAVTSLSAALPAYGGLSPALAHAHPVGNSQPFIIRPGGAVVQSYSVTYPHRKPAFAVKPVHSFSLPALAHHVPAVQSAVAAIQPVHSFQTVQSVPHLQPIQPDIQPAQPVATVQPIHHFTAVQHLPPVAPPVQSVVQTSFIPPAPAAIPALAQAPNVAFSPAPAAFPTIPNYPHINAIPVIPNISALPVVPDVPAVPAIPSIPTIPSIPNFPQPQVPSNGFFPLSVQPPLNQNPPAFGSVNPQAQFPGFGPIAGSSPDFGSANASPQIPLQPLPSPEPELPLPQAEPTQTPWKPVLYEPPTAESPIGRPAHTLLPPYGSSPAQGYLPPAPTSHSANIQQEYTSIDSGLFDNLSDADIQQIFDQASLAAHRDHHHHHTVHNYHNRY